MIRRLARWAGRAALGIAALALIAAAFLQSPPGRNLLRRLLVGLLQRDGLEVRLADLDWSVVPLEARLSGLVLSVPGRVAFLELDQARVRLNRASLRGAPAFEEAEARGLKLTLERAGDGRWNLPSSDADPSVPTALDLEPYLAGRVSLHDVDVRVSDTATGLEATARRLDLDWPGSRGQGLLRAGEEVVWSMGGREGRIAVSPAVLARDGPRVTMTGPELAAPEGRLAFSATVDGLAGTPRVEARARGRLDLRGLAGEPWDGGLTLEATATGGSAPQKAEVDARPDQATWADLPIAGRLHARAAGSDLSLEGALAVAEGSASFTARFPAGQDGRVEATWNGLDVRTLLRTAGKDRTLPVDGRLKGTLRATVPPALERLALDAETIVEPSSEVIAGRLSAHGRTSLRLRDGRYAVDLDHELDSGVALAGRLEGRVDRAALAASSLKGLVRVGIARPQDLVSALAGGPPPTIPAGPAGRIDTELTLGGTLGRPSASGSVTGRGLIFRGSPPIDADAQLEVDGTRITLDPIEARAAGARLEGRLRAESDGRLDGRLSGGVPALGEWSGILPSGWNPAGRVELTALVSGTTASPIAMLDIEGTDVAVLGQPTVSRLDGQLAVSREEIRVSSLHLEQRGDGEQPGGGLERRDGELDLAGRASADLRSLSFRADAHDFALAEIPPGALGGTDLPMRGRASGQLNVEIADSGVTAGGRLELDDLAWASKPLGKGTLALSATGDALQAEMLLPTLSARASASVVPKPPRAFTAELSMDEASLGRLGEALGAASATAAGTTTLRARIDGEADHPSSSRLDLHLAAVDGKVYGVPVRLIRPARIVASADRVTAEGELKAADLHFALEGSLSSEGSETLRLRGEGGIAGLAPLLAKEGHEPPVLQGSAILEARLTGTPSEPRPEATLHAKDVALAADEREDFRALLLDASFREGRLAVDRLDAEAIGHRFHVTGEAEAGLIPESWPARLRKVLGGKAHARAHLTVEPLETPDTSEEERPPGTVRIEADVETDALSWPRLRGRAEVQVSSVEVQDLRLTQDRPLVLELEGGRLTIPEVTWQAAGNDLRLGGTVRLPAEGAALEESTLDVQAAGALDLRLLGALARGIEAGGAVKLETRLQGSLREPKVVGGLQVEGAVFRYRPWRLNLDDLTVSVTAQENRVVVERLAGTLNGGTIEGSGELQLRAASARGGAIRVAVEGAVLDWPPGFRGTLEADLEMRGTEAGPVLGGTVSLDDALYRGDPRTLGTAQTVSITEVKRKPFFAWLGLDLRFRTGSDVRVDNPFGAFAFAVDVAAAGSAQEPRLSGQVSLRPDGFVYWNGRKFTLERGSLDWKAAQGLEPFLQARARARVSSYDVTADFSGPVTKAEARLASDPPLSSREITSLLVTGSTSAGGADARAVGIVSANFLGNLGRVAGLDSVRIESGDDQSLLSFDPTRVAGETNPAQRLTITKRLRTNLEVTVSLNLSESGKTTTFIGWKPRSSFEVRLAQRDDYTGSLEFRHDVALGGGTVAPAPISPVGRTAAVKEAVASVQIDDRAKGDSRPLGAKLSLGTGKKFDYESWQRDRRRLEAAAARLGYFEAYVVARRDPRTARPPGGPVALSYVVDRGPRTAIAFRGFQVEPSVASELRRAWSRGDYARSIEDEALLRIRMHLAKEGYFTPRLTARLEASPDGSSKTLIVEGEPGPREKHRRIVFEGASEPFRARLQEIVAGKEREAQSFQEPRRLEEAVAALYRGEGYLAVKAKVRPPAAVGDTAVLTVDVDEGPLFRRGEVRHAGCVAVSCADVEAALGLPAGEPYRERETAGARDRVLALYRKRGFNAAKVRFDGRIDPSRSLVHLDVAIEEGPRQVVAEVVVAGGEPGTRRALAPLITIDAGDPVVLEEWAAVRRSLYETGLVRGVSLEPEAVGAGAVPEDAAAAPASEPVRARLTYDEWPKLRLRYGLQLVTEKPLTSSGSQAADLGGTAELTRATLFGRAISTGLTGEARVDTWNARAVLSAPRSFGRPMRTSLYLVRERDEEDVTLERAADPVTTQVDRWQITLEERFRPRRNLEVALSYDIQWLEYTLPVPEPLVLSFRPARLIPTVLLDGRNNVLDPGRGYFSSASFNYGAKILGSEFDFRRIFTQQYAYVPLPGRLVSASGLRYERSSGEGQSFLTTERLGFGGPTTVRGYERDELDVLDLLSAFGATTEVLLLNQELRFPILGDVRGVAFLDFGQIWAQLEGNRGTLVRVGTGLGLRYSTAVGVLRFDVGYPLRGEDRKLRLYFGLGQAF